MTAAPPAVVLCLALGWAMIMCGSAGVVFSYLTNDLDAPPALAASWRLAWVELLQTPFLLRTLYQQYNDRSIDRKDLIKKYRQSLPAMAISGICLGFHFSAWVLSLQLTSLAHSLLWVSMGPILLNIASWVSFFIWRKRKPSRLETLGALLGVLGSVFLLLDVGNGHGDSTTQQPSWQGDLVALTGAATVTLYLVIGSDLRKWMPLWIYAFAVNGFAYATSVVLALIINPSLGLLDILGFARRPYLLSCFYLGLGPGVLGHTLINFLIKYISPLTVSSAMLSEPLIGGVLGYIVGMQAIPGWGTWVGGFVVMLGLFLVLAGEYHSNDTVCQAEGNETTELSNPSEVIGNDTATEVATES